MEVFVGAGGFTADEVVVFEAGFAGEAAVVAGAAGFAAGEVALVCAAGLAAGLALATFGLLDGRLLWAAGLRAGGDVTACGSGFATAGAATGKGGGSAFAGAFVATGRGGGPPRFAGDVAPSACGDAASRASGFGSPDFSIPYLDFESRDRASIILMMATFVSSAPKGCSVRIP